MPTRQNLKVYVGAVMDSVTPTTHVVSALPVTVGCSLASCLISPRSTALHDESQAYETSSK